jgi:aerobic carbon-monoxide dehydrogenase small subunit
MMKTIKLQINGQEREAATDTRTSLADFLRHGLGLTGTHVGCEHGVCGTCTVLLDGASVRSCLMLAVQVEGHHVETIEGLARADGRFHPLQEAFRDKHGLQCGYCTPGMLMAATALLRRNPKPTLEEVKGGLDGNLCRCTGYTGIFEAIQACALGGK